jgi:hypothetical protein
MKKIWLVIATVLMMWSSAASAAEVILFKNSSAAGWDIPVSESYPQGGFKQGLEKDGLLKNEAFPTAVLAVIAYNYARAQKLPAGQMAEGDFKKAFLFANNLPLEGTITVDEFRRRGPAGQFVLPDMEVRTVAPATAATEAVAPTVAAPSPKEVPQAGADAASPEGMAKALAILNGEVKALKASAGEGNQKALKEMSGRINALGKQLTAIKGGQASFAAGTVLETVRTDIQKLQAQVLGLTKFQADLKVMQGRVDMLEQKPAVGWDSYLYGVIGLLALGILASFATNWRRISKVQKAQKEVELNATNAVTEALSAKQKVQEVTDAVVAVAAEVDNINKVGGYRKVTLPTNFDVMLKALVKGGDSHWLEIKVGDEICLVDIMMNADGLLIVRGIKEVIKPVKSENLKHIIYRAAKLGDDGSHRIVGVSADAHLKAA